MQNFNLQCCSQNNSKSRHFTGNYTSSEEWCDLLNILKGNSTNPVIFSAYFQAFLHTTFFFLHTTFFFLHNIFFFMHNIFSLHTTQSSCILQSSSSLAYHLPFCSSCILSSYSFLPSSFSFISLSSLCKLSRSSCNLWELSSNSSIPPSSSNNHQVLHANCLVLLTYILVLHTNSLNPCQLSPY